MSYTQGEGADGGEGAEERAHLAALSHVTHHHIT
jgi:hypothetical protein